MASGLTLEIVGGWILGCFVNGLAMSIIVARW